MICDKCECEMFIWKSLSVDIPIYFVVTAFPLSLNKRIHILKVITVHNTNYKKIKYTKSSCVSIESGGGFKLGQDITRKFTSCCTV